MSTYFNGVVSMQGVTISSAGAPVLNYYWVNDVTHSGLDSGSQVAFGSTGSLYSIGNNAGAGVISYSDTGTVLVQKEFTGVYSEKGIVSADGASLYLVGESSTTGGAWIAKISTSTNLVTWQRELTDSGSFYKNLVEDSSGNIYAAGEDSSGNMMLIKYSSAGSIVWQKSITTGPFGMQDIVIDSSNNVYLVMRITATNSQGGTDIAKISSSGSVVWQTTLYLNDDSLVGFHAAMDTGNNLVVSAVSGGAGDTTTIFKLNSAGNAIVWQTATTPNATYPLITTPMTVDSSNNLYVTIDGNNATTTNGYVLKFNTSNTLVFQREFSSTLGYAVSVRGSDTYLAASAYSIYLQPYDTTIPGYVQLTYKLPDNGSSTGTYDTIAYQASSMTFSTPSVQQESSPSTVATSSYTDAASTHAYATTSYTSTKTVI